MECQSLESFIETAKDVREYRRALSIKLAQMGVPTPQICGSLGLSPQDEALVQDEINLGCCGADGG